MSHSDYSSSVSMPSSTATSSLYSMPSLFPFASGKTGTWIYTTGAILVSLLILEQTVYRMKKRQLPGSSWTIPLIGKFADSLNPSMDGYKAQWASGALSAISVFNIFVVMASTNEFARKILNSPTYAEPCLVYSAKKVLSPDNWVFLTGKVHVEYRRGLNLLFTRKALGLYVHVQDLITRKHFAQWNAARKDGKAAEIMMDSRILNMDTSLRVFCGDHLPDHAIMAIHDKYWMITKALELVNFPFAWPGTKIYNAIQARKVAMGFLEDAARKSKLYIAAGNEPQCLLDEWVRNLTDPNAKGRTEFSDHEMALVILSFLFASQDAMSSGLIYGFQHLADHPEILAKVREEQERIRQGDMDRPVTLEMIDQMTYLSAFVKESLRVMPPVIIVPYKTTKAFPISEDYTVPAGSMLIPAFYPSTHDAEVYPEPDTLNPDRWLDPNSTANQNPKNYLIWGAGPHKCIGIEYATMNMMLVLGTAAVMWDWEHEITPDSYEVDIIATLFPKDGCRLKLTPRTAA